MTGAIKTNASGSIWSTVWTSSTAASPQGDPLALELSPSGNELWSQPINPPGSTAAGLELAVNASNVAVTQSFLVMGGSGVEHLHAFSPDGTSAWEHTSLSVGSMSPNGSGTISDLQSLYLVEGPDDNPVTAGTFLSTIALSPLGPLTSAGGKDIELEVFGADGNVRKQGRWGGPGDDILGAFGVDPGGNVVLVGIRSEVDQAAIERFFVAKVAP